MAGTSSTEAPGWGAGGWDRPRHVLCVECGFNLVSIAIEVIPWQNVALRTAAGEHTSTLRFLKIVIQVKLQDLLKIMHSKYIDLFSSS